MDKKLSLVKYPREFTRYQRPFSEIKDFKANEYRNFLYYLAPALLDEILEKEFYEHFLLYVTFIRILTQKKISKEDIADSRILIDYFLRSFKKYYGKENLTYKLHSHVHLPTQVENFGPLNEITCFPFEGSYYDLYCSIIDFLFYITVYF